MNKLNPALLIPILLCSFLIFSSWAAYQAATRVSDVSDRDYYSKGLKYNSTLIEKKAASSLGWQLRSEFSDGRLVQYLTNSEGLPVSGATGLLKLQDRDALLIVPLEETQPGIYHADLPHLTATQMARAEFELNGARILRHLLLAL